MDKTEKVLDNVLLYLSICLAAYFIIRLIEFSKLVYFFPVNVTGDIPSYMAQMFFLSKYHLFQQVPNWFNGMPLLLRYPPAWHYFALFLYYLTKSVTVASFLSMLLTFIALFIVLYSQISNQ